jgi:hypothetical protein
VMVTRSSVTLTSSQGSGDGVLDLLAEQVAAVHDQDSSLVPHNERYVNWPDFHC